MRAFLLCVSALIAQSAGAKIQAIQIAKIHVEGVFDNPFIFETQASGVVPLSLIYDDQEREVIAFEVGQPKSFVSYNRPGQEIKTLPVHFLFPILEFSSSVVDMDGKVRIDTRKFDSKKGGVIDLQMRTAVALPAFTSLYVKVSLGNDTIQTRLTLDEHRHFESEEGSESTILIQPKARFLRFARLDLKEEVMPGRKHPVREIDRLTDFYDLLLQSYRLFKAEDYVKIFSGSVFGEREIRILGY